MKDMVKNAFYDGEDSIMIQDIAVEAVDPDVSLINKFAKLDELMLYVENPSIQEATPNEIRDKLFTLINGTAYSQRGVGFDRHGSEDSRRGVRLGG